MNYGNVIVTTRNQGVRIHASASSSVDVSRMGPEDATNLLLNVAGLDSESKGEAASFVQASEFATICVQYETCR